VTTRSDRTRTTDDLGVPKPGRFDHFWWGLHRNTTILAIVLIAFLCVLGAFLYRPLLESTEDEADSLNDTMGMEPLQFVGFPGDQGEYIFTWDDAGDPLDLYRINLTTSGTQTHVSRISSTPYSEIWPAPSPVDDRLAFFAVSSSGERSLRILESDGLVVDASYDPAVSGLGDRYQIDLSVPPYWSPDGQWIAFLGRCTDRKRSSVELFISEVARSRVYRLTGGGNEVIAMRWIDPDHILYAERRGDQSIALYQIAASTSPTTPLPLGVLESE
jgi:hypothetical protein